MYPQAPNPFEPPPLLPPPPGGSGDALERIAAALEIGNQLRQAQLAQLVAFRQELAPHLAKLATIRVPKILGG